MGGPSRESWLRSEEARKKRLKAMRTRAGVVDLAEWRAALRAAEFLRSTHGGLPMVLDVRLLTASEVGFEVVVKLVRDDVMLRRCLPRSVNDVPVRVEVVNPGAGERSVSAPDLPSDC
jgi:hypothetical protein